MENIKIGCIGCGFMGSALISSIAKTVGGSNIVLFDTDEKKSQTLAKKIRATVAKDIPDIVENCTHVLLAVKPVAIENVLESFNSLFEHNLPVIISIAAGVAIKTIKNIVKDNSVVRLMPNLPATVGEAMIALATEQDAADAEKNAEFVKHILSKAGKVEQVPESLMDAVTGVSGSGPAYAFMFIEAMADAAVLCGMPRNQAYIYAAQTLKGSAEMVLKTGRHPADLKDAVCSPAGTTIEGVKVLEDSSFRSSVMNAVIAGCEKSKKLGKK